MNLNDWLNAFDPTLLNEADRAWQTAKTSDVAQAAVLVPIYLRSADSTLLFNVRPANIDVHAGQVCFPGGRREPGDQTPVATARRETYEELGIDQENITVIAALNPFNTTTGFEVTPIVALIDENTEIVPNPEEVADTFELAVDFFLDAKNSVTRRMPTRRQHRQVQGWPYQNYFIWGMTGMIVHTVIERVQRQQKDIKSAC